MSFSRIYHTAIMCLLFSPMKRAKYLGEKRVFHHVGKNCMVMFRKIPLYPELISLGDNVWIASNVSLITHDVIHHMLNYKLRKREFPENIGCIEIEDNVFIGANSTVLPNVSIGSDTIIAAGTLVNKSIQRGGVYAGVPARYICSLDEFIEKRKQYSKIVIEKVRNGDLSDSTVRACWERFKKQTDLMDDAKE